VVVESSHGKRTEQRSNDYQPWWISPSISLPRTSLYHYTSFGRSVERAHAYINHPPFGSPSSISLLTTRRVAEHSALHLIPVMAKACVALLCVLLVVSSAFLAAEAGRQWDQGGESGESGAMAVADAATTAGRCGDIGETKRKSPGGPDPHHHSMTNGSYEK
jgi:hypothetical protein